MKTDINNNKPFFIFISILLILLFATFSFAQQKTLRLEAAKIEGKLTKPQVALISLEKRPIFKAIALSNLKIEKDIFKKIDNNVFENRIYTEPFKITSK